MNISRRLQDILFHCSYIHTHNKSAQTVPKKKKAINKEHSLMHNHHFVVTVYSFIGLLASPS
jgi:hypothetical protein